MDKIAIYDMDRTITRIGTYTPFLFFAAKKRPLRLLLLPLYLLSLIGYPLRLLDRKQLKQIGFALILGRKVSAERLELLSADYARHVCVRNMFGKAQMRVAADKAEGCVMVLATASPDFYAAAIGKRLGFDHIIATRQSRLPDGGYGCRIASANCYGAEKLSRIVEWLPGERSDCDVRFYSDHHSDGPVFEWADRAIAANPNEKLRALAQTSGWELVSFE